MDWLFVALIGVGLFLLLVYVLREWLLWREDRRRRRMPLDGARIGGARANRRLRIE